MLNLQKRIMACEKKKDELVLEYKTPYEDLTNITKQNRKKGRIPKRKLDFSIDSNGNKYKNYFFDEKEKIINEIRYQRVLERYLNEEVSLNPKARGINGKRFPDYLIKKKNITWDLKTLDGESLEIIDNVLGKEWKKKQSPNVVMHIGNCPHSNKYLKEKIIEIFDNGKRQYIKEVMLFSKNDSLLLYLKR